ncbi:4-(cytidine 5'-diphospho)-2-C-methyl-D-erythritol kinase [Roseiterribacter gracilis]|uniref:4-diphosphocytidyl-2-C-methyl-D-erythritol kinase n=1 Tax=Roseiterribacter gracilis TaxID=2812848 RepID=A0A8S8XGV4_9PROT|nr:4-diphosphocytidyl-2-C-methyl-D-erythritol kinase [Rhodospirillales bacterium TMPK1]
MDIRVAAPAKLNLYLHVVGKRADGYHLLDSLVAFAADGDVVSASPAPSLQLTIDGPFADGLSNGADNLVHRAASELAAAVGRAPAVALTLTKNLPVASGIGGGSADAAAALRALCDLWSIAPDDARVEAIAAKLGADVPVCLRGEAAYLVGIGHETDPAPSLPAAGLLLVNPRVPLPTPPVFKARSGPFSAPARLERAPRDAAELGAMLAARHNDLAAPAITIVPAIRDILTALEATGGVRLARMSGSGATCFALYDDEDSAIRAAATLNPSWWALPSRLSTRLPPPIRCE